jgi:chromosome condensin MukBEF complex kleisin-like MukF subunit
MGIINQIIKPSLVQKHTLINIYKTLARPILTYGSESWIICKSDRARITANEVKFLRRTAGYTELDKKRNTEILREVKINSVLEHIEQYRNSWKQHVQRMDRSCILRQMITYRPKGKRSFGRPLKRWRETVTGH